MEVKPAVRKKSPSRWEKILFTSLGQVVVEGPLSAEEIAGLILDEGLRMFRPAWRQKEALETIARSPEGRVVAARLGSLVGGYVTFHPPDRFERWGRDRIEGILELGAIEVAPRFRQTGVGTALIEVAMSNEELEDYIVITTEYWWHWDLEGTGLTIWQYRQMLEKGLAPFGLFPVATDEPEIASHPANALMVRVGSRVSQATRSRFENLLFAENKGSP
ncbi:MAG: GNAT family N-acetyltransferase [Firmicutes bacterium]|nr:GNAT family N-acetyltransferase [Bacillota bacterium]